VMRARTLTSQNLKALADELLASHVRVVAPAKLGLDDFGLRELTKAEEMRLDGRLGTRTIKEWFLPPSEVLLRWKQKKNDVELEPLAAKLAPTVIIGARPCDAAAVEKVDRLMNWDYKDELWNGRREATTIVSLACPGEDNACFCTAVGLGPDSRRGADLMLTPQDGGYYVEVLTDKGEKLASEHAKLFTDAGADGPAKAYQDKARAKVSANLAMAPEAVRTWLEGHFEDQLWKTLALRCHGCGACAAVCPTCHCFDIVDEPDGFGCGARRRNWDTCQTARFTVHGSGHNPRADQNGRYRQRILHKFAIFPKRFGEILCTGCGRCVRACPGGMDLTEVLTHIDQLARTGKSDSRGAA
jgi:ferredoxin